MAGRQDHAETVALQALAWVAADEDALSRFLAVSGLAPGDLAARAGDPDLLAAVLDFVMAEDDRVIAFCTAAGLAPQGLAVLRASLPGGAPPHWT